MNPQIEDFKNHPLHSFLETYLEANQLLLIIDDLEENNVHNYQQKEQAIYKNLIINLSACFEVSLNTILKYATEHLLNNLDNAQKLPNSLKIRISSNLNKSKDDREIWKISGDGWKEEVNKNFEILKNKFNSPRPENIDKLFHKSLGLKKVTNTFHWDDKTKEESIKILNYFLDLRGQITHHYKIEDSIDKSDIPIYFNFLYCLGTCISNYVRDHLINLTNVEPWYKKEIRDIIEIN
jgi:hypothetical protein